MKILAGSSSRVFARKLAISLNLPYIESSTITFNDTETRVQIHESVHDDNVVIVHSTSRPVNDHLMELLLLINTAKLARVANITVVIPYFGYARQERSTYDYGPILAQLIATLLETAGANSIITIDLHAPKIADFFTIPVYNLDPVDSFIPLLNTPNAVIVAPDNGSTGRAYKISQKLNMDVAYIHKRRLSTQYQILDFTGNVQGKHCIIIDDIVDSGETLCNSAEWLAKCGAFSVDAFITHAVLSNAAKDDIQNSRIKNIYITDTIATDLLPSKFHIISAVPIVARTLNQSTHPLHP